MFAAFSAMWGTLAALLANPPYSFGSGTVGAFGFLGVIGLLASPAIGNATDRFTPRLALIAATLTLIMAFLLLAGAAHHIVLLLAAIVFVDIGNRIGLIANQTRIYALSAEARSRLNTALMTSYFLGGAAGAGIAAVATEHFGWLGLSFTGVGFAVLTLVAHLVESGALSVDAGRRGTKQRTQR
jgi:predicted MFS family arabinose efflux permease